MPKSISDLSKSSAENPVECQGARTDPKGNDNKKQVQEDAPKTEPMYSYYQNRSWLSMTNCSWVNPIIKFLSNNEMKTEYFGKIEETDAASVYANRLKREWKKSVEAKSTFPLAKSLFN